MSDIYNMKLHDVGNTTKGDYEILRVPGGWIYTSYYTDLASNNNSNSTFVPFDNEFQEYVND